MEKQLWRICVKHAMDKLETIKKQGYLKEEALGGLDLVARYQANSTTPQLRVQLARGKQLVFEDTHYLKNVLIDNPDPLTPLTHKLGAEISQEAISSLQTRFLADDGSVKDEFLNHLKDEPLFAANLWDFNLEISFNKANEIHCKTIKDAQMLERFETYYTWVEQQDSIEDTFWKICSAIEDLVFNDALLTQR